MGWFGGVKTTPIFGNTHVIPNDDLRFTSLWRGAIRHTGQVVGWVSSQEKLSQEKWTKVKHIHFVYIFVASNLDILVSDEFADEFGGYGWIWRVPPSWELVLPGWLTFESMIFDDFWAFQRWGYIFLFGGYVFFKGRKLRKIHGWFGSPPKNSFLQSQRSPPSTGKRYDDDDDDEEEEKKKKKKKNQQNTTKNKIIKRRIRMMMMMMMMMMMKMKTHVYNDDDHGDKWHWQLHFGWMRAGMKQGMISWQHL